MKYGIYLSLYDWDHHRALRENALQPCGSTPVYPTLAEAARAEMLIQDQVRRQWGDFAALDTRILAVDSEQDKRFLDDDEERAVFKVRWEE